jgi:outer membrane lipoprotein SlyB
MKDPTMNLRALSAIALTLSLAACATGPGYHDNGPAYGDRGNYPARCANCGVVERIEHVYGNSHTTGAGAVIGGVVGGVLGNTVGKGDGRTAATVVGAVGGAVAGNAIEKHENQEGSFDVYVRMDNGQKLILNQRDIGNIREGSYVEVDNNKARLLR